MSTLTSLLADLAEGRVEVIDLTAPLSDRTPVIQLPPPFANTQGFALQEISNYDERGPAWYWNNISAGEHVGTHFDAPVHWVTGKDGLDVAQVPATQLVGPAVVVDKSAECAQNPDFLLEIEHLEQWQQEHGPLPAGGWVAVPDRLGRPRRRPGGVPERQRDRAAHARASRSPARAGSPSSRSSASASRRSAPMPGPPTASIRRSPATRSCSGPASTA